MSDTAHEGLERRLGQVANIILRNVESDAAAAAEFKAIHNEEERERYATKWRNNQLKAYRDSALRRDAPAENFSAGRLTARLYSYIHNEFNFNAPRPIARGARVSHIVIAPLFAEKVEEASNTGDDGKERYSEKDPFKRFSKTTSELLKFIWKKSHHEPRQRTFRGGKDKIFDYVREMFDFTEPFITPKRSIITRKQENLDKFASSEAIKLSKEWDRRVEAAGPSNRLTNTVEYFVKGPPHVAHFRWTRHARPYQTYTLTDEVGAKTVDAHYSAPFERTALHAFPENIFDDLFGRYVQGAHYVIVPVEMFFNRPLFVTENVGKTNAITHFFEMIGILTDKKAPPTLAKALAILSGDGKIDAAVRDVGGYKEGHARPSLESALIDLGNNPAKWDISNSDEFIASIFDLINADRRKAIALDRFIIAATEGYVRSCFGADESIDGIQVHATNLRQQTEYVGNKCMDGRAYVFSNLGNNHTLDEKGFVREGEQRLSDVFTRTVIVDCGMNRFQRGRLLQNLTEFAAERTMSILWIARFRLVHNALNAIEAMINLAVANYHDNKEQLSRKEILSMIKDPGKAEEDGSIVPYDYWHALNRGLTLSKDVAKDATTAGRERKLIIALEFLSSCLTILNNYIEGGIVDRSGGADSSRDMLEGKLKSIRERSIVGHQSLGDFLNRRFVPISRVIGRTGQRYHRMRERIAEVSDLINAKLSATEWHEHQKQADRQTRLLRVAEYFGEAALGYYGASLLVDLFGATCAFGDGIKTLWSMPVCEAHHNTIGLAPAPSFLIYALASAGVIGLAMTSWVKFRREHREDMGLDVEEA